MVGTYEPLYVIPEVKALRRMRASELPPFNEAPRDESKGLKGPEQVVNELLHLVHAVDYMTDDTLDEMMQDYIYTVKGKYRHPVDRDKRIPLPEKMLDDFAVKIYSVGKEREPQDRLSWEFIKWMGYTSVVSGGVLVSGGGRMMMKYLGDLKKKANEQYKLRLDEIDLVNVFNMGVTGVLGAGSQIIRAIPSYTPEERERIEKMSGIQYISHLAHTAPEIGKEVINDITENKSTRYFWAGWFGLTGAATAIGHLTRGKGPLKESALVVGTVGAQVREMRKELKSDITKSLGNTTDFLYDAAKRLHLPVSAERVERIVNQAGSVYLADEQTESVADDTAMKSSESSLARMNMSKEEALERASKASLEVPGSAIGELHGQERDLIGACMDYANEGDRKAFWEMTSGFWRILQGGAHIISPYRALGRKSFVYSYMRQADARMDWASYVDFDKHIDVKLLEGPEAPHE